MKLGISFAKTITYQLRWFVLIMEMETSSWYVDMFYWTAVRIIILLTTVKWIINLMTSIYINS